MEYRYEFEFSVNNEDFLELYKFVNITNSNNKGLKDFLQILFPVISFLLCVYFIRSMKESNTSLLAFYIVFFTLAAVASNLLVKPVFISMMKKSIESTKKRGKSPYERDIIMKFGEDWFFEITSETESKSKYSVIDRVIKGNKAVYVFVNDVQLYLIPFSVFDSEQQEEEFIDFIKGKHSQFNNKGEKS